MYEYGEGVPENKTTAANLYRKAADQGSAAGQANLGTIYETGEGLPQDHAASVIWYRKSAEQGYSRGQYLLARMYDFGQGVLEDKETALTWYKKAAEQGYVYAEAKLGEMYRFGVGTPVEKEAAAFWYRKAAEHGDAFAQTSLGIMFENGEGIPESKVSAANWYRKAAEQGDSFGQYLLGTMYDRGAGVPKEKDTALAWYRKAADQGSSIALVKLGDKYDSGDGVTENKAEAVEFYRKAADLGDDEGQFSLGGMYLNGAGVPRDEALAASLFRKAAEQGHIGAQYITGLMLLKGNGAAADPRGAANWFEKAAAQGDRHAQLAIGLMYSDGTGVPQNLELAHSFIQSSALQGEVEAQKYIAESYAIGRGTEKDEAQAAYWRHKFDGNGSIGAVLNRVLDGLERRIYIGDSVGQIYPGSPAIEAGLLKSDIIIAVNGIAGTQEKPIANLIYNLFPGEQVTLDILRYPGPQRTTVSLTLQKSGSENLPSKGYLGVAASQLSPKAAADMGIAKSGELIQSVITGGAAAAAGLVPGDVIFSVNGASVTEGQTLTSLITKEAAGTIVRLGILRNRTTIIYVSATLRGRSEVTDPVGNAAIRSPSNSEWLLALSVIDKMPKRSDYWILKVAKGVSENFSIGDTVGQTDDKGGLRAKGRAVYIDSANRTIIVDRVEGAYFTDSDLLSVASESQARTDR
jgi:TPR repeat protein